MFRALLLTTASLTAGVLAAPGAALAADTSTSLTAAEMSAALKAVAATTATAEIPGYAGSLRATLDGRVAAMAFAVDPATGRGYYRMAYTGYGTEAVYAVAGKGEYDYLTGSAERAAAKMAGRPEARYVFVPNAKLTLDGWSSRQMSAPSEIVVEDARHAGTKTTHDDGSADYSFTGEEKTRVTFTVDATGVVTRGRVVDTGVEQTITFGYGPQTVTLPATGQVISQTTLTKAVAYYDLARKMSRLTSDIMIGVDDRARGRNVTVAAVRKGARAAVAGFNESLAVKVVTVRNVTGGVTISATNPYTGVRIAYRLKLSGKHTVARKL
ncbi:hypothetical protein GCM10010168_58490 [Actinoplanes ianthinogenes]|uniref:Uncharacterized protein n=1 Tax=Actinoplanes ianthinogenes TaxID=122358 RepID=A0ABM7M284_9ACTN|nr:hypothetical protein [Actinoplanes ianthinogenes]BCJ45731.1 hypothetical protein Aiant_63880 [Actinoplanes ianthinogenes]GGR32341.1 hypothetical protein GCM10010168_58490 [Actinoplanes ianthinogenes]